MLRRSIPMRLISTACLLFIHAACFAAEPSAADGQLTLRGQVVLPDGQPAAGAIVFTARLKNEDGIKTDEAGRFEWRDAFTNDFWFRARSSDRSLQATLKLSAVQLRELRRSPITIKLTRAREHRVIVRFNGKPVANADVSVNGDRSNRERTNTEGVATVRFASDLTLHEVVASRVDLGIGGQSKWQRGEITGDETVVELLPPAPCTLVAVDDQDNPIPDLKMELSISLKHPRQVTQWLHYTHSESLHVQTDSKGEAVVPWMPRDGVDRLNCVPLREDLQGFDDVVDLSSRRVTVKFRSRPKETKETIVQGRVEMLGSESPEGLLVRGKAWRASSTTRVRADGTFSLPVTPGQLHAIDLVDVKWSAKGWTGIPITKEGAIAEEIRLKAEAGTPVTIRVTQGAERQPLVNAAVYVQGVRMLRSKDENGEKLNYRADPIATYFYTDERGQISFATGAGELKLHMSVDNWDEEQTIQVEPPSPKTVDFHRAWIGNRRITVRTTIDGQPYQPSSAAKVYGSSERRRGSDGSTVGKLETNGSCVLDFDEPHGTVRVVDSVRKLCGSASFDTQSNDIQVNLRPMATYRGRLVDQQGKPLAGQRLHLIIRRSANLDDSDQTTDADGRFQFALVISEVPLVLRRVDAEGKVLTEPAFDDERYFLAGEDRDDKNIVIKMPDAESTPAPVAKRSFDDRITSLLRDVRLASMHALIVIEGDESPVVDKLSREVLDYDELREVGAYLPLIISSKSLPNVAKNLDRRVWPQPTADELALVALDGDGMKLGDLKINASKGQAAYEEAATFVRTYAPKPRDAVELVEQARATAKKTARKVLIVIGGARCGPCFLLARWLDDHHDALEKDFVIVKFDEVRALRAPQIVDSIKFVELSVPRYAITDADGKVLVTSDGPLGNIGMPSSIEGIRHFKSMLEKTTRHMTLAEIVLLLESLESQRD